MKNQREPIRNTDQYGRGFAGLAGLTGMLTISCGSVHLSRRQWRADIQKQGELSYMQDN